MSEDVVPSMENVPDQAPARGELFLRMTELEDQIRGFNPSLKRRRGWGLSLTGAGLAILAMSAVQGDPEMIIGGVVLMVTSLAPWVFFAMGVHEVRWLKARIREIEKTLESIDASALTEGE